MIVKTVTYRRVKNLGNYESETVEWTAEVEDRENPFEVTTQLKQDVLAFLNPYHPKDETDIDDIEF